MQTGDGGGGEEVEMKEWEQRCEAQLTNIDELEREMRRLAQELSGLAEREVDARRDADRCVQEAERRSADQDWLVRTLEREASRLADELARKDREAESLADERTRQQEKERAAMDSAAQGDGGADPAAFAGDDLARALRSREMRLRDLEDRELSAEDVRRTLLEEQRKLAEEHRQVTAEGSEYFARLEREIADAHELASKLNSDVKELCADRRQKEARNRRTEAEQEELRLRFAAYEADKLELEDRLRQLTIERDGAAAELSVVLRPALVQGSDEQLCRLEETMMLLKANALQLATDVQFLGEVFKAFADSPSTADPYTNPGPLDALCMAFDHVQEYIYAAHGPMRTGERWVLSATHEARYDEVEQLLAAMKQMVACFDMLDTAAKRQVPCAGDVVQNSSHLVRLARESATKFEEMIDAREQQKKEDEESRAARVKQSLARSRMRGGPRVPRRTSVGERRVSGGTPASQVLRPPSPQLHPIDASSRGVAAPPT